MAEVDSRNLSDNMQPEPDWAKPKKQISNKQHKVSRFSVYVLIIYYLFLYFP